MVWAKGKTLGIFYLCFLASLVCAGASMFLLNHTKESNHREMYYIIFIILGTGIGCLWFRLFAKYLIWTHGIVHTVVLVMILVGRSKLLDVANDDGFSSAFELYGADVYTIILYIVQYILSFHFVVFRYGKTESARAWRTAFHSYCGTLVYFCCVLDATLRVHIFPAPNNDNASNNNAIARVLLMFTCGVFTWYMLLNPYFDWRRLEGMRGKSRRSSKKRTKGHSSSGSVRRSGSRSSTRGRRP